jgi:hypothetical protein
MVTYFEIHLRLGPASKASRRERSDGMNALCVTAHQKGHRRRVNVIDACRLKGAQTTFLGIELGCRMKLEGNEIDVFISDLL